MNRLRHDFLAGARLARHQDRAGRASHRLEHLEERLHRAAASQDAAELVALLELRSQVCVLRSQLPLVHRLLDDVHQLVEVERLGDEVGGALLDGIHRVPYGPVAGDDDADDRGVAGTGRVDHLGAVYPAQPQVGDQQVEGELLDQLQGLLAAVGLDHLEPPLHQALGGQLPEGGFVIDQEQMGGGFGHSANILTQGARARPALAQPRLTVRTLQPIRVYRSACRVGSRQSCDRLQTGRLAPERETMDRQTLSIMKACEVVGVSRRTIYNWISAGKVEYIRTAGGAIRIFADSLWRDPDSQPRQVSGAVRTTGSHA